MKNYIYINKIFYFFLFYGLFSISTVSAAKKLEVTSNETINDQTTVTPEYPDKFRIQLGSYFIRDTNTEVGVNSTIGNIGTVIDLERDLGTDDKLSIPKINAFYRFNDKHRIDFSWLEVDRKGTKSTALEFTVGDEIFAASSVVETEIKTKIYKLAYAYSFYRSPKVELSFSAGLNIMDYDVVLDNKTSGKLETAQVTAPLPVFGLLMDYAISPRWLVHFRFETFYIELNDKIRGSLIDSELGIEYRMFKHVGFGVGFNRFSVDAKVKSSKYTGGITDLYRGVNLYAAAYF